MLLAVEPLPNLKQGDTGHSVRVLQALLGLFDSEVFITGVFDHQTRISLMRFQRLADVKTHEMGKSDAATWTALIAGVT